MVHPAERDLSAPGDPDLQARRVCKVNHMGLEAMLLAPGRLAASSLIIVAGFWFEYAQVALGQFNGAGKTEAL